MTISQALSILQPEKRTDESLKSAYRAACLKHHPDKGGDAEIMKLVNVAYETLEGAFWSPYQARQATKQTPLTETMQKIIERFKTLKGVKIEVCGSWLWISGNTREYKTILKQAGLKFSKNKLAWYYHEDGYRKKSKKTFSMDQIRKTWGSTDINTETAQAIA